MKEENMNENKKPKIKTIDDIEDEEFHKLMDQLNEVFSFMYKKITDDETFLIGRSLFDNMSYGSRRVQELCNLTFGE